MQPQNDQNQWDPNHPAEELSGSSVIAATPEPEPTDEPITWRASEYIHHEKSGLWFVILLGVVIILIAVALLLVKSWTFAALIVVMAAAVTVLAYRPPHEMQYQLTAQGFQVNDKTFSFHDFRAFGVVEDGPLYSIVLIPNKRFMPAVTVYFPAEQGEEIVDVFGSLIPMEDIHLDIVDRLTRSLRF